jgi:hypothetical protein
LPVAKDSRPLPRKSSIPPWLNSELIGSPGAV